MGNINKCAKANPHQDDLGDMRDDKARREYYLNMNNNGVGSTNYDITEKKRVGYGHI
jgi:hypothetical protein